MSEKKAYLPPVLRPMSPDEPAAVLVREELAGKNLLADPIRIASQVAQYFGAGDLIQHFAPGDLPLEVLDQLAGTLDRRLRNPGSGLPPESQKRFLQMTVHGEPRNHAQASLLHKLNLLASRITLDRTGLPIAEVFFKLVSYSDQDFAIGVTLHTQPRERTVDGPVVRVELLEYVSAYMLDNMMTVVDLVRRCIHKALLHELDECFHVDGVRVFDPHEREGIAGPGE